jgi:hypothetical protein
MVISRLPLLDLMLHFQSSLSKHAEAHLAGKKQEYNLSNELMFISMIGLA